jgi:hypothetical protein
MLAVRTCVEAVRPPTPTVAAGRTLGDRRGPGPAEQPDLHPYLSIRSTNQPFDRSGRSPPPRALSSRATTRSADRVPAGGPRARGADPNPEWTSVAVGIRATDTRQSSGNRGPVGGSRPPRTACRPRRASPPASRPAPATAPRSAPRRSVTGGVRGGPPPGRLCIRLVRGTRTYLDSDSTERGASGVAVSTTTRPVPTRGPRRRRFGDSPRTRLPTPPRPTRTPVPRGTGGSPGARLSDDSEQRPARSPVESHWGRVGGRFSSVERGPRSARRGASRRHERPGTRRSRPTGREGGVQHE